MLLVVNGECDQSWTRWRSKTRRWAILSARIWKTLVVLILPPRFLPWFVSPHPSKPQKNPPPTMLMVNQVSYKLERSKTHCQLDLGHHSFHSCTRNKCIRGFCPLWPEGSELWTTTTADQSFLAGWYHTATMQGRRIHNVFEWGIQAFYWNLCHTIACRNAIPT